jgi:type II secretory pathway pseudopilin PulG
MSILEVVIAASIILILTTAIGRTWQSYIVLSRTNNERTQVALLLEETSEILGFLRDVSWTTHIAPLTLNTPYYINWNGSSYSITSTPNLVQSAYTRTFSFSSVLRDGNDNIASVGITDADTRKVTITISASSTSGIVSSQAEILLHDTYSN